MTILASLYIMSNNKINCKLKIYTVQSKNFLLNKKKIYCNLKILSKMQIIDFFCLKLENIIQQWQKKKKKNMFEEPEQ